VAALHVVLALVFLVGGAPATTEGAVGPGAVSTVVGHGADRVVLSVSPNSGGLVANTFAVRWTRRGNPVRGTIRAVFTMQAMPMPSLRLTFRPRSEGVYRGTGRVLTMPGRWEIRMHLRPRRGAAFDVVVVDRVTTGILE
jgi:YtkA-like protein